MAISNRDRVGRGFELLAAGLVKFVDDAMTAAVPVGQEWIKVLEARDAAKHGSAKTYSKTDPQVQLKVLTEEWRVFKDQLSRVELSFASELRDVRNRWAHNDSFSPDDTYRALDSMERLLTAAGAADQAEGVRKLRLDHQRAQYEAETRKAVKAATTPNVPGTGLKPWREVIKPHPDVASGQYNAAEFAADLHYVATENSDVSREYSDPVAFFQRTYLTEGLRDLLSRAARRIAGDMNASPIVNLQTNFGGGKTHSMLALYHLCSGRPVSEYPQEVQDAIGDVTLPDPGKIQRVALVGTHLMPGKSSVKKDGTEVRTLWGELAWQLGGRQAYEMIAEADKTSTNPGAALGELIAAYAPCLILIDEWVAYARGLYGKDDLPAGTFDTQFTFAQTLTEVVKSIPGALLVISIPASDTASGVDAGTGSSDLEVGGPNGQEALRRLQNVVRRVADQWRPASAYESFEIVRRRLFEPPDAAARGDIAAVARQFVQFYAEHRGEFPRECGQIAYEDRIKAAYPIHPELFDRLYEDWSTLERFQRTRGVLRLMSAVVHALWTRQDASPLIMAGSVPLDVATVASELTQYLPDAWKPIIDADIDGEGSTPVHIDAERATFGQRALTRRIARTVFVGAAPTLHTAHKGIERQNVWLGVAVPGDTVGNFGSALEVLSQRATYFYVDGARYWYDTQVSVTRTAQDHADRLREHPEEVWAELLPRLAKERSSRGDFAAVHPCPEDSGGVPDTEEAKLVILHPQYTHRRDNSDSEALRFATVCLDRRGTAQRVNRNSVVFLAPDDRRMEELADAARDFLAWRYICERTDELNLTAQQKAMAERRKASANQTVDLRIAGAYIWLLVPEQPDPARPSEWHVVKAEGSQPSLADRATAKLRQGGLLATKYGARNVRMDLDGPLKAVWERGHVSVGDLWSYYRRYPYLTRLRDRAVLDDAVRSALDEISWDLEGFALAQSFDEQSARYQGLAVPPNGNFGHISDSTLLVLPTIARQQEEADRAKLPQGGEVSGGDGGDEPGQSGGDESSVPSQRTVQPLPPAPDNVRFFGVMELNPERYGRDLNRIAQEVLQHLAAVEGARLQVRVEITAEKSDGFPDDKVRIVTENAKTLKFEQFGFEKD
ncbi:AAA family ATPase [Micromonospora sp. S4605]|uniref:Swt1 family HEPN domain-containing protein n=1 Tax=Micromonospora sp. S4605 TaxID=1420897 RepID=UPI000D6FAC0A|nr:Swt1 family HEPN domain-containing protein [Micromonospora sp. S4605]PWU52349.1 AAA family ATPase [Micromonospora sp. S4605]